MTRDERKAIIEEALENDVDEHFHHFMHNDNDFLNYHQTTHEGVYNSDELLTEYLHHIPSMRINLDWGGYSSIEKLFHPFEWK